MHRRWGILAMAWVVCGGVAAQSPMAPGGFGLAVPFDLAKHGDLSFAEDRDGRIAIEAVASHNHVRPGQTFTVALRVTLKPGWVWYSPRPGGGEVAPMPADLDVQADGFTAGPVRWPPHQPHESRGQINNSYEDEIIVYVPLTVPDDAAPGERIVTLTPQGQLCGDDLCFMLSMFQQAGPAAGPVQASAPVTVAALPLANLEWTDEFSQGLSHAVEADQLLAAGPHLGEYAGGGLTRQGMLGGFLLALLAGLILNIMPCVLPVIPLKVLSIAQQAKESRRRFIVLGLAFAGGIVLFFVGLAVVNGALRSVQSAFQWGEHFQVPAFRIAMAMLMVALAVNLFGGFTVLAPRRAAAAHGHLERGEGVPSAVGMGVLTAVLSTPCSFAILTAAFVWAQAQSVLVGSAAIVLIGVGMAAPYALLTAMPNLVRRLPKPGVWMEHFKQSMGFVLLLVAVWLIGTFSDQAYPFWVAAFAVVLAFCLWMWGSWVRYDAPLAKKTAVRTVAVFLAVSAGFFMLTPPRPLATHFGPYDHTAIEQALRDGRIVLIDFTADWCVNCKVVEKRVYNDPEVAARLRDLNVLAIRGDITTKDLPAHAALQTYGDAIPVTILRANHADQPIRLRGIFSKHDLFQALDTLEGTTTFTTETQRTTE
ncbi:MAG: thioredoxin family protein [Phycisphaerae bacterium]|nr:thioredoxin family protein [Phycisphaerae bacterium]